jgi:hypothetical protein
MQTIMLLIVSSAGRLRVDMSRQGQIFTPTTLEVIRGLADQGKTAPEIAYVIGSTPGSVRVKCCQFKIKLMRRGRPTRLPSQQHYTVGQKVSVYLRPSEYAALKWKAAHMQKSAAELAAKLLEAIIGSNIFEAVLDEDG